MILNIEMYQMHKQIYGWWTYLETMYFWESKLEIRYMEFTGLFVYHNYYISDLKYLYL